MKTTLFLFTFLWMSVGISGQDVFNLDSLGIADSQATRLTTGIYFSYDASGNRMSSYRTAIFRESQNDRQQSQPSLTTASEFSIGPSPTEGPVTVSMTHHGGITPYSVTIYDTAAQPIAMKSATSASVTLDITTQPKGVYIVEVEIEGNRQSTKITKK